MFGLIPQRLAGRPAQREMTVPGVLTTAYRRSVRVLQVWRLGRLARHEPDHRKLLEPIDVRNAAPADGGPGAPRLDAVIVPTCRPFEETKDILLAAADLAADLQAVLVLLCSKQAEALQLPSALREHRAAVAALAVDDPRWHATLPTLETSGHALARTQGWDTPLKRNLALLGAAALRWQRILFLDDDVTTGVIDKDGNGVTADSVRAALRAMTAKPALRLVGWRMEEFPDNSVVCHARRLVGLAQTCFVGASALIVEMGTDLPFFPQIYNEDWLFNYGVLRLMDDTSLVVGDAGTVVQRPYYPFLPRRAKAEEAGDVLAEGLFGLLSRGRKAERKTREVEVWQAVVDSRREMIRHLQLLVRTVKELHGPYQRLDRAGKAGRRAGEALRDDVSAALSASLEVLDDRNPDQHLPFLVVDYLEAWRTDLRRWRKRMRKARADRLRLMLADPELATLNPHALLVLGVTAALDDALTCTTGSCEDASSTLAARVRV
jgi:hypothetical protein